MSVNPWDLQENKKKINFLSVGQIRSIEGYLASIKSELGEMSKVQD